MQLYGRLANKAQSLDQMREMMYNLPKYIPITRMPPTSRAFYFHMLHVYLQVNTWMHLRQVLNPDDYGFMTNSKGNIVPRITDKGVAPAYLLKEIKCSCTKPNREGVMCSNCNCTMSGLSCTDLCKCNAECSNSG